ncbi:hypothetical protein ACMYYO_04840 [Dermacoccaceae bacterium W4C1]
MLGLMRGRAALPAALTVLLAGVTMAGCSGYASEDATTSAGPPSTRASATTLNSSDESKIDLMLQRLSSGDGLGELTISGALSSDEEGAGGSDPDSATGILRGRVVCSGAPVRITVAGASKEMPCDGMVHELRQCGKGRSPDVRIQRTNRDTTVTPYALGIRRVGDC